MSDQNDDQRTDTDADEAIDHVGPETSKGEVEAVASDEQNAKLEHTMGGSTTRDDANDMGVPMLPGSPDEPQGPEDALGEGPTRGDYRGRIGPESYHPHESLVRDGEHVMEAQRPRTEDIGDVAGKKGGVETAGESADSGSDE